MSCLSYINDYGSDSTNSDSETEQHLYKRVKLPVPDLSRVRIVLTEETHIDDHQKHKGRKRSFPHVRGNWATFVYVQYPNDDFVNKLSRKVLDALTESSHTWHKCENLHITLSKTVVLNYHWIAPFHNSLKKTLTNFKCFELEFDELQVLCNEDKSRTFVVLKTNRFSHKHFFAITKKVDEILSEFKLPKFYDEPSFHMSILWTNGDKETETNGALDKLNQILTPDFQELAKNIFIDKVYCKSGNKTFQYHLPSDR